MNINKIASERRLYGLYKAITWKCRLSRSIAPKLNPYGPPSGLEIEKVKKKNL